MQFLIPDTIARAGMFAYIAGSPYVFIKILGIPANEYGYYFGLNGIGLMIASQLNRKLIKHLNQLDIIKYSILAAFITGLLIISANTIDHAYFLLVSLFLYLFTLNFISPNSLAMGLEKQGHQAGSASALYGCSQWIMASSASSIVGLFHNGSMLPMTIVMFSCGLLSLLTSLYFRTSKIQVLQ